MSGVPLSFFLPPRLFLKMERQAVPVSPEDGQAGIHRLRIKPETSLFSNRRQGIVNVQGGPIGAMGGERFHHHESRIECEERML